MPAASNSDPELGTGAVPGKGAAQGGVDGPMCATLASPVGSQVPRDPTLLCLLANFSLFFNFPEDVDWLLATWLHLQESHTT